MNIYTHIHTYTHMHMFSLSLSFYLSALPVSVSETASMTCGEVTRSHLLQNICHGVVFFLLSEILHPQDQNSIVVGVTDSCTSTTFRKRYRAGKQQHSGLCRRPKSIQASIQGVQHRTGARPVGQRLCNFQVTHARGKQFLVHCSFQGCGRQS